ELVQLTFDRVWREEMHDLKRQQLLMKRSEAELKEKVRGLSELARTTRSEEVKRAYEDQIEETLQELKGATEPAERDIGVSYRTALSKCTTLLNNPVVIWDKVGPVEKQRLFFFLFEKRLAYTKGSGYRTANELSTVRLFEDFTEQNSDNVDRTGFEPATLSLQMRCSTN
ncbi:MAG: Resolvase-like protein, partial [Parcubacteria group bacterium]|nr:Resolvase-like protein [Parcubacteria group bacterium]